MKEGNTIKARVELLVEHMHRQGRGPKSVRKFCLEHGINYGSLHNAFAHNSMGIQTVHAFKAAVPDLNMNWFLYGEGQVFVPELSH